MFLNKKMVLSFLLVQFIFPEFLFSQKKDLGDSAYMGIRFENDVSWIKVKERARQTGKYIFVDCYTTWCKPCKAMDKDVFPDSKVGDLLNREFVSYKIQMDKLKSDDLITKNRYIFAEFIEKIYKIKAFPTYLFFSSDGALVHKVVGYQKLEDFLSIARTALTPGKTYDDPYKELYRFLNEYNRGRKNYDKMPDMILKA